jgi:LPPG:FO 2-phospho-L-lactate transferase
MAELGHEVSSVGIAGQYRQFCDLFLIDDQDAGLAPRIEELAIKAVAAPIIMETDADKVALAETILRVVAG